MTLKSTAPFSIPDTTFDTLPYTISELSSSNAPLPHNTNDHFILFDEASKASDMHLLVKPAPYPQHFWERRPQAARTDHALLDTLTRQEINSIPDVIATMKELDAIFPEERALKAFNYLYMRVTEQIGRDLQNHRWHSPKWLERLDVIFAKLYFIALQQGAADPRQCPLAWRPLFTAHDKPKVACGIAGMAAHIFFDLPRALMKTCEEMGKDLKRGTDEHRDYQQINEILRAEEVRIMIEWAGGFIRTLGELMGSTHEDIAMWVVTHAREKAWTDAQIISALSAKNKENLVKKYFDFLAQSAAWVGRTVLV